MLKSKKKVFAALFAFSIFLALFALPAGKELVGYYICLSEIGREDYASALETYRELKALRAGSSKDKDLTKRITDLAQYHYNSANYYVSIRNWELARKEIEKAYILNPVNSAITLMNTQLNLANISSKDLLLQKGVEFSQHEFYGVQTNPLWDCVLTLSDEVFSQYDLQGEQNKELVKSVDKFCASADGSKYACVTTKIQGAVKTPEIWIGHTKQEDEKLKLISFRDHILRGFSGFSIDTDNIQLIGFSPDNKYLFFNMLSSDASTLWKYNYSTEKSETFENVKELAFKPNSNDEFCYTKPYDKEEGDVLYKYSSEYGRAKVYFDAHRNNIERPLWSPDGKYISFYLNNIGSGKDELFIITPNCKTQYRVGSCENTREQTWSPQGDRLYYLQEGKLKLWLATNKNYTLADLNLPIKKFKLSPGGNKIIMLTEQGLWLSDSKGYNNGQLVLEGIYTDLDWVNFGQNIVVWQEGNLITYNFQVKK